MMATTGITQKALAALAATLVVGCFAAGAPAAGADELSDVRGELDAKAAQLGALSQDIAASQDGLAEVDGHIESILADIGERQAERAALQDRIAALAKVVYKDDSGVDFMRIITSSESMGEVLSRMEMRNKVLSEYSELSQGQQRAQRELEVAYRSVSNEKDAQYERLAQLKEQKAQLDAAVAELQGRESELDAAQRKALEEAAAAASRAEEAVQEAEESAVTVPAAPAAGGEAPVSQEASSSDGASAAGDAHGSAARDEAARQEEAARQAEEAAAAEAARQAEAAAEAEAARQAEEAAAAEEAARQAAEAAAAAEAEQAATSSSGWMTGLASAYGGSSDPSTPNPGTTATGAVCDDWSMGVAVPIAWGPAPYYGRSVEISYNGMVVVATVNDCGGMGGGSRALDLQPGVFKALGASTCTEWGVREVQYRFL